jgi:hypothetical protein
MGSLALIFALVYGLQGAVVRPAIVEGADPRSGFKVTADVTIEGTDVNSPDIKRLKLSLNSLQAEQSPQDPGLFTFSNVPPGNNALKVGELPEGAYVKSARVGSTDVLKDGLNVGDGRGPMHINVVIGSGGTIEGLVTNERGDRMANATVVIVPDASRRQRSEYFKYATTDASGQFKISGIAPGDYAIFAWEGVKQNAWLDPGFLEPFEGRGTVLRATEETKANLQIRAIRTER